MPIETPRETFIDMFIGSILISVSFALLWIRRDGESLWITVMGARVIAFGWFLLFVHAVGKFGKRGLWLLLGGLPAVWVMLDLATEFGRCLFLGYSVP
jgi:hypothetical protein